MKNVVYNLSTEGSADRLRLHLVRVWVVDANSGYDVKTSQISNLEYVAVRTEAGNGIVEMSDGSVIELNEHTLAVFKWSEIKHYFCKQDCWSFKWYCFEAENDIVLELNNVYSIIITENERRISEECLGHLGGVTKYETLYAQCLFESLFAFWTIKRKKTSKIEKNIECALSWIMKNLSTNIKVSEISQMLSMSERNFRYVFKKYVGMPPKKYIEEKRLAAAKELIDTTTMMIKEISHLAGFSNQYYFSKCFKKKYGCPPTQSRTFSLNQRSC